MTTGIDRRDRGYDLARRRALARLEQGFDLGWTPPESWAELQERRGSGPAGD